MVVDLDDAQREERVPDLYGRDRHPGRYIRQCKGSCARRTGDEPLAHPGQVYRTSSETRRPAAAVHMRFLRPGRAECFPVQVAKRAELPALLPRPKPVGCSGKPSALSCM